MCDIAGTSLQQFSRISCNCIVQNAYARRLLNLFVAEYESIYGSYFLSFNVHNLIYLCDDVLRFGPLPNFSAYPFENFLQYLKKLLRRGNQALQQIVKRVVELGNANLTKKIAKFDTRSRSFRLQHDSGPLIPNLVQNSMQYKEMYFGPWFLSCRVPDNCVYLADASVIGIENIIRNEHEDFTVGRKFSNKSNLFSYPLSSSSNDIFRVSELSDSLEAFPLNNVKCI